MTIAEEMVDYALAAFKSEFPESIYHVVIEALVDQYGLQIGGSEFPWSTGLYSYTIQNYWGTGNSSITRFGESISPVQAAFINSSFAHAQDFDDSHLQALTHPGSVVIPAAMAIGEHLNLSGKSVLQAIIVGMEIMLRLAYSISPACIEGGHHTPPTVGPFGAAIAAGLLLGLSKSQFINALGICGSYSGASVEYTLSGGSVKRMHTGFGARAGVEAALLAEQGITGPATIIEGKKGIWAVFGRGQAHPERLWDKIGKEFMLSTLKFKLYNCCYLIHPAIKTFLAMCKENCLNDENIKEAMIGMSQFSVSHAGSVTLPKDDVEAQFSTSFSLALSLIKGPPGMWSYSNDVLSDEKIIRLTKKIKVYEDEKANQFFPERNECLIKITTVNDKEYIRQADPMDQLSAEEIKEKFFNNVEPVLDEDKAMALYQMLLDFRSISSVRAINYCIAKNVMTEMKLQC